MATQSAMISIGMTRIVLAKKSGIASASLQCGALEAANIYSGGAGLLASQRARYKLPSARVPFGDVQADGSVLVRKEWYDALNYVVNTQLGGITGPSLSDITTTVASSSTAAIDAQNAVSVVAQTVNANADALAATVQVTQTNSLSGSSQIPPVVRTTRGVVP